MASTVAFPPRSTVISPPPFPASTHLRRLRLPSTTITRSSLPTTRHPTRRPNHLRSKHLPTLTPSPPSPHPDIIVFQEEDPEVVVLQEAELVATVAEAESAGVDVARALLDLSWYVAAVFAVQTVAAVVVFGGVGFEKKERNVGGGEGIGGARFVGKVDGGEDVEFGERVEEIRTMAREARASEANRVVGGGEDGNDAIRSDVRGEVSRRVGRMKKSELRMLAGAAAARIKVEEEKNKKSDFSPNGEGKSGKGSVRRKLRRRKMRAGIMNREMPEGFDGSKSYAKSTGDVRDGGIQQIDHDKSLKESPEMHNWSTEFKGDLSDTLAESVDFSVLPSKNSFGNNNAGVSNKGNTERLGSGEAASISGFDNNTLSQDGHNNVSLSAKDDTCKQTKAPQKTSRLKGKAEGIKASNFKSSDINKLDTFQVSPITKANSHPGSPTGAVKLKSVANKGYTGLFDSPRKLWWLKLSFVLGVCMHRESGSDVIKGLYNLKTDPHSDCSSSSYTIFFQDRTDAMNLCYLLETFFEDLGGVSADIVPVSIKELDEAVRTKVLNVIVIGKGQLHLYAGQPLAEVEMAIRSLIEQT